MWYLGPSSNKIKSFTAISEENWYGPDYRIKEKCYLMFKFNTFHLTISKLPPYYIPNPLNYVLVIHIRYKTHKQLLADHWK